MSQVQFAPKVSDDIRRAQKMFIGGEWVGAISGRTSIALSQPLAPPLPQTAHGGR